MFAVTGLKTVVDECTGPDVLDVLFEGDGDTMSTRSSCEGGKGRGGRMCVRVRICGYVTTYHVVVLGCRRAALLPKARAESAACLEINMWRGQKELERHVLSLKRWKQRLTASHMRPLWRVDPTKRRTSPFSVPYMSSAVPYKEIPDLGCGSSIQDGSEG